MEESESKSELTSAFPNQSNYKNTEKEHAIQNL